MSTLFKLIIISYLCVISFEINAQKPQPTIEDFFKNLKFSNLQLSPNGKYLAVLSPINDRKNIVILETEGLKNAKPVTKFDDQDINNFSWANDNEIVFDLDSNGNEAFSLYKINVNTKRAKVIELVGSKVGSSGIRSASIVHMLPNDPDHIIIQYNGRNIKAPDLYKLPLNSKWDRKHERNYKMDIIAKNPGGYQGWLLDHDGDVRGALSIDGLRGKFYYKNKDEEKFRVLREYNIEDENITPLAFDFDNKTLFVSSNIGRDTSALYYFHPEKNELGELIFGMPEVDVSNLMLSIKRKKLLGVKYLDEYPEVVYFDTETAQMMASLESAFKDKVVNVTSRSKDEVLNIVYVGSDTDPGHYYLYDKAKNTLKSLVSPMDWLDKSQLSPMKPIKFNSRDGLTIRGYLTIPKDSNGKSLPLIVNPHGGPYGIRNTWGFNPETQFFASRGYATVQVNFRGSGGYGRRFQQAGYGGKWGSEMQNDLTDAVKYLVSEGVVDPKRVCIYGSSYGGYATMAGLTYTPEIYKCGINYVGITDVSLLFDSLPKHWEPQRELLKKQIGDPDDEALMKKISPLYHVDKIVAPLMIVQGAKDPRVVKKHATDLRDALEDRGIVLTDDEWIMKDDEGHGFQKEENKIELYTKIEKFLNKHL
ncbi:S9 family peptidase [Pseudoalteromonas carrageenovora]|uniref:alpha/beta hydrolase family protein n=1 Tax=Pseudoalteromonas carrageenovora TaxID=227 RepID=UPI0026E20EE3|nr:S9 family peptidase [Pseudoalteromonas carrageenovora]MDO6836542.1 S9 family peptidase [Pseudoalteromonas carrageenovora]